MAVNGSPCKRPAVKRSLSSLSSQINEWNESISGNGIANISAKKAKPLSSSIRKSSHQEVQATMNSTQDLLPWYMKYEPKVVDEVAIHKLKLKEVTTLLQTMLEGKSNTRIILLSGPSGSSKSTLIKLLADKFVPMFRSRPLNSLTKNNQELKSVVEYSGSSTTVGTSNMNSFNDFLTQSTLRVGSNLSLLLVEDLPNVFHTDTRLNFQKTLLSWLYSENKKLPPLVICLTECEIHGNSFSESSFSVDNQFIAETVLGKEILSHPFLTRVKFNPINATLMTKFLKSIAKKERASFSEDKWKQANVHIKELARNCGDIRNAISALEFWATSSQDGIAPKGDLITREQSVSYFHCIGKLIYGSKELSDDNAMINDLMDSTSSLLGDNLKLGILENYSTFHKQKFPITSAEKIVDALSLSDIMSDGNLYTHLSESLEYPCRKLRNVFSTLSSTMQHQDQSPHGRLYFPRESKMRRARAKFEREADEYHDISFYKYQALHSFKDICLLLGFYAPLIRKKRDFKKKVLNHYLSTLKNVPQELLEIRLRNNDVLSVDDEVDFLDRIGGEIGGINSTQDASILDEEVSMRNLSNFRNKGLERLKEAVDNRCVETENEFDDEFEFDPVVDSDDATRPLHAVGDYGDDDDDDDDDDDIYEMLASQSPRKLPTVP